MEVTMNSEHSEGVAGREMDAAVSRAVFGRPLESMCVWFRCERCDGEKRTVCGACGQRGHGNCYGSGRGPLDVRCEVVCDAPAFSEDITCAWKVVEKMEGGFVFSLWTGGGDDSAVGVWAARFSGTEDMHTARADTAPLAICRAALKAATSPTNSAVRLHGQPYGFTWDDVDLLREVIATHEAESGDDWLEDVPPLTDLAGRIAALLPPREEA